MSLSQNHYYFKIGKPISQSSEICLKVPDNPQLALIGEMLPIATSLKHKLGVNIVGPGYSAAILTSGTTSYEFLTLSRFISIPLK